MVEEAQEDARRATRDARADEARAQLLGSFEKAVGPLGLLDWFQVAGVVATWWGDVQNDLRTVTARGFLGLVEAWETSIVTALQDGKSKDNPLDHRLVRRLLPEYLADLADLEAKKGELETTIKGATGSDGEDGDEAEVEDEQLSDDELAALKKQLGTTKKALKVKEDNFTHKLKEARAALQEPTARDLGTRDPALRPRRDPRALRRESRQKSSRVRDLVGQVPGHVDQHRERAGRCRRQAARIPGGVGVCLNGTTGAGSR